MISKPNRHPVVRFFISSTFSDMERERDILQRVFKELKPIYRQRGWQLEAVDLRWGINENEGKDNRTMSICLNEIRHCKSVSPQPNFIMLVGQRYGWMPLPEKIALSDYAKLKFSNNNLSIFKQWYKLDENTLPEPYYILLERKGSYIDDKVFNEQVVEPLSKDFLLSMPKREIYGHSATELEILEGAWGEQDVNHVIAYVRKLRGAPSLYRSSAFSEKFFQHALRKVIKKRFRTFHYIDAKYKYADYDTGVKDEWMYEMFKKNIIDVVEKEIKTHNRRPEDFEIHEHIEYADRMSESFIGRKEEIKKIFEYVNYPEADTPLWIKGKSGCGKTALVSKIAALHGYNQTTIVFCGLTENSSSPKGIKEILKTRTMSANSARDFGWLVTRSKIEHLFIVDNAGLDNSFIDNLFHFYNSDGKLAKGVKVIFTSTIGDSFYPSNDIKEMVLAPLSVGDAEIMLEKLLKQDNRTLSSTQKSMLKQLLLKSNNTAAYLQLLRYSLARLHSWEIFPQYPLNYSGLSSKVISDIVREDEQSGYGIAKIVLSALSIDRIGLNDDEILDLVAFFPEFHKKIQSFHSIQGGMIPPIIWSRFYDKIRPFLSTVYNKNGAYHSISSSDLRSNLKSTIVETKEGANLLYEIWKYYRLYSDNPHLCSQVLYIGVVALETHRATIGQDILFFEKLSEIINTSFLDKTFVSKAFIIDKDDVLSLIDKLRCEILGGLNDERSLALQKSLFDIRKRLSSLAVYSHEATMLALGQMPMGINTSVMENQFSKLTWRKAIVDNLSCAPNLARITPDGSQILYIQNHGRISSVFLFSLQNNKERCKCLFKTNSDPDSIGISDDASTICLSGSKKSIVFSNNQLYHSDINTSYSNVSADGTRVLFQRESFFKIFKNMKSDFSSTSMNGCRMTRDGQYVWTFISENQLARINIANHSTELIADIDNVISNDSRISERIVLGLDYTKEVVACSEHYCVVRLWQVRYSDTGVIFYIHNGTSVRTTPFSNINGDMYGNAWIDKEEKRMLVYERTNLILFDLHELKHLTFLQSVEMDPVLDVTPDFSILITRKGDVIDFDKLLKVGSILAKADVGINAINYSKINNSFVMSVGKTVELEYYPQYHSITKSGDWIIRRHNLVEGGGGFVSASVVSNAGDVYVICVSDGLTSQLEIRDIKTDILIGITNSFPNACTAIRFSKDDNHIIAGVGTYDSGYKITSLSESHIYMFNRKGEAELDVRLDDLRTIPLSTGLWMTDNMRFIITEDLQLVNTSTCEVFKLGEPAEIIFPWSLFSEFQFNLLGREILSDDDRLPKSNQFSLKCITTYKNRIYYSIYRRNKQTIVGQDTGSANTIGWLTVEEYNTDTRETIDWKIQEKVVCSSSLGIYTLNEQDDLTFRDFQNKNAMVIDHYVQYAAVTDDGKYVFVSYKNGLLKLKKNHKDVGVAYLGSSYDMHVVERGLVASNREGELFLFEFPKDED